MNLANEWIEVPNQGFLPTGMEMMHQKNEDLMVANPVQQLIALSMQGKLSHQRNYHSR